MKGALKVATVATSIAIATTVPATADTALYVGGTGWPGTPTHSQMTWLRNDVYAGREDTLVGIGYPASPILMNESIAIGARKLGYAVTTTEGRKSLVGVSQGGLVVHEEQRRIMALPENQRPADDELRFVYIGDPARPSGGIANWVPEGARVPGIGISRPAPLVETPYETVYVTREYDGIADFPDRPLNLLSTTNAVMGVVYLHPSYGVDLTDVPEDNIAESTNTKGGKTTSYLVPTRELPLTKPLRQMGVDRRIVDEVDKHLRPVVDAGYKRNDTKRNSVSAPDPTTRPQRSDTGSDTAADSDTADSDIAAAAAADAAGEPADGPQS
jgi:hypothetical protein